MDGRNSAVKSLFDRNPSGLDEKFTLPEQVPEYTAYANGRVGNKAQLILAFCKADGSYKAFSYSHLFSIESDEPELGFTATFSRVRVHVRGRNLLELQRMIWLQRVAEIVEAGQSLAIQSDAKAAVVESIRFE